MRAEIRAEVEALKVKTGKVPGLAVVLVGGRKDSETYVRSKKKACDEAGIVSFGTDLPEDVSEAELLEVRSVLASTSGSYDLHMAQSPLLQSAQCSRGLRAEGVILPAPPPPPAPGQSPPPSATSPSSQRHPESS